MRLYTCDAIRRIEDLLVDKYGFDFFQLMDYAGSSVAERVLARFPGIKSVAVLCGGGNNGGDGLVAARYLLLKGINVKVIAASRFERSSLQTMKNKTILEKMGETLLTSEEIGDTELLRLLDESDVIIDALLGIGATSSPRGEYLRLVRAVNQSLKPVVSIDLPSGLNGSTGEIMGEAVKADVTVTFWGPKVGLYVMPGKEHAGEVLIANKEFVSTRLFPNLGEITGRELHLVSAPEIKQLLPLVTLSCHKGKRGSVLIFAGSKKYKGAAALVALGALRAGAGRVILVVPEGCLIPGVTPETIVFEVPSRDGTLTADSYTRAMDEFGDIVSSIVIGPGIGRTKEVKELVGKIWKEPQVPTCMDADALYFLPEIGENTLQRRHNVIITPHEGEAARLMGSKASHVSAKRLEFAKSIAEKWCTVLLKGAGTVVDDGNRTSIIKDAHPCLSVPGSGDVLSGVIGAFLARGLGCYEAGLCAACLHARAGVSLGSIRGNDGILAGEIADRIPEEIKYVLELE